MRQRSFLRNPAFRFATSCGNRLHDLHPVGPRRGIRNDLAKRCPLPHQPKWLMTRASDAWSWDSIEMRKAPFRCGKHKTGSSKRRTYAAADGAGLCAEHLTPGSWTALKCGSVKRERSLSSPHPLEIRRDVVRSLPAA